MASVVKLFALQKKHPIRMSYPVNTCDHNMVVEPTSVYIINVNHH